MLIYFNGIFSLSFTLAYPGNPIVSQLFHTPLDCTGNLSLTSIPHDVPPSSTTRKDPAVSRNAIPHNYTCIIMPHTPQAPSHTSYLRVGGGGAGGGGMRAAAAASPNLLSAASLTTKRYNTVGTYFYVS